MYKLSFTLIFFFIFTGCSIKSNLYIQEQCSFADLLINDKNSFCAAPRATLLKENELFIGFDNGAIASWDLKTNKLVHKFTQTDLFSVQQLLLHKQKLYAASRSMQLKRYSLLGELEQEKNYEKGSLFCLENLADNIYAGFGNAQLGIINADNLELLETKKDHEYLIYSLHKDKSKLYSGGDDNKLLVWEITSQGTLTKIRSLEKLSSSVRKIVTLNSFVFAGLGDGTIIQFDVAYKQTHYNTNKTQAPITALVSTKKHLLSGDSDGKVTLYSLDSHKLKEVKSIKLESAIRSIVPYKDCYMIITQKGFIQKETSLCLEKK